MASNIKSHTWHNHYINVIYNFKHGAHRLKNVVSTFAQIGIAMITAQHHVAIVYHHGQHHLFSRVYQLAQCLACVYLVGQ